MSSSLKNKVAQKPIALLLLLTAVFIAQSQPHRPPVRVRERRIVIFRFHLAVSM